MDTLLDFWAAYGSTVVFAMVNSFFALSCYAVLSVGVLSFTTVVFAAIGGFLAAQLVAKFGVSLYLTLPLAAIAGGLGAAVVAKAFLKLQSHWMALASLALVLITRIVALNAPGLTGGVNGLFVPARIAWWELGILLVLVAFVFYRLYHSWYGLASLAVREDPAVAATMGIKPRRIQFTAFIISGLVGGLGGACLAFTLQFISPETYFIGIAFTMIASTVLGGSFHWLGPVVGAAVFTALPVTMQAVAPAIEDVAKGVALLLIMIFLPRGLVDPRAFRLRRAQKRRGAAEDGGKETAHA
ncbi:branched-chain amino acid ABC transporter permease [Acuticoccus sp. I52.16.1]|uniref:branched-chain amino acid ABC transporter permease n=1 Tax=Acuticoccus sp. I52.16.1 TaxID=2928472 RepID=UPI001FD43FEB|nr:branched-chain amino acid ABC transporter permease [Acuticoccus sp. I52.16.1]UOM35391.1 branched-chain amino acid ABC transporter permease [Acuticoccus sp. I52.16.1]